MIDKSLDILYDGFDVLMRNGQFAFIDFVLCNTNVEDLTFDEMLAILTITLAVKDKLEYRHWFLTNVRQIFCTYNENIEELLEGLN